MRRCGTEKMQWRRRASQQLPKVNNARDQFEDDRNSPNRETSLRTQDVLRRRRPYRAVWTEGGEECVVGHEGGGGRKSFNMCWNGVCEEVAILAVKTYKEGTTLVRAAGDDVC